MTAPLRLRARPGPLEPVAAAAEGPVATRLGHRLATLTDAHLGRLQGVAGAGVLVVTGAAEDLPWVDGVRYLGRDPEAPGLLVPTTHTFELPAGLVERALLAHAVGSPGPFALLADPLRLVPLGGARAIDRARLQTWLAGAR